MCFKIIFKKTQRASNICYFFIIFLLLKYTMCFNFFYKTRCASNILLIITIIIIINDPLAWQWSAAAEDLRGDYHHHHLRGEDDGGGGGGEIRAGRCRLKTMIEDDDKIFIFEFNYDLYVGALWYVKKIIVLRLYISKGNWSLQSLNTLFSFLATSTALLVAASLKELFTLLGSPRPLNEE